MRGRGSPTSMSRTRIPPMSVCKNTSPGGSAWTEPMMVASLPSGWARMVASAVPAIAGETIARSLPSLAMVSGSRPRISQAPRTPSCTGMARSSSAIETSEPRASGVDKGPAALAGWDALVVAGAEATPRLTCRLCHRGDDAAQVADGETFLQDEACREIERFGTCHGQVVDGAVDCQFSNIPSREEEGAYYVGVGCESQALACPVYAKGCCVIHGIEQGVREGGCEDAFNEVVGGFAATAMAERDFLVAQIEFVTTCLPCALDLFEDVVDACIIHSYFLAFFSVAVCPVSLCK